MMIRFAIFKFVQTRPRDPGIKSAQNDGVSVMVRFPLVTGVTALALILSSCGGGSTSSSSTAGGVSNPTASSTCALRTRQDFAFATLNEWYLFPETLPASLDPSPYTSVQSYIDALTASARAQGRDRNFTYITSIAEETAFFSSGSSAGFGIRLSYDAAAKRAFIAEAFEGAPALIAGIDRGDEIIAVGATPASLRTVTEIITAEGTGGVSAALGPSTAGTIRTLRLANAGVTREVTVTKADYALTPVSSRYGTQIINDGGKRVGYINLRTFISTADPALRTSFANFRAQGITEFIVDFRYNGGGLVSTAELLGDLLGGNRTSADTFSNTTFRASKSGENSLRRFAPKAESVSPVSIAFIGTGATASASELVINAFIPYLGNRMALVGANTFGKPVGQIAIDKAACDDRIRVVAFSTRNASNSDAYFSGLASSVGNTCRAEDDVTKPLGDPQEASTRAALDFLAGQPCIPISAGQTSQSARAQASERELLTPASPSVSQREVPGSF
jgi:carboxyl-terminal processing protease